MKRSVAVIGSFKQHNEQVQQLCAELRAAGVTVTSPQGVDVLQKGIDFVRFSTDNPAWSDLAIQSLAMHRILRADLVYVVTPCGYIGRTTCYEVGRIVQLGRPIYFSERPADLPLYVPSAFILDESTLIQKATDASWSPCWLFEHDHDQASVLERELITGTLRND